MVEEKQVEEQMLIQCYGFQFAGLPWEYEALQVVPELLLFPAYLLNPVHQFAPL